MICVTIMAGIDTYLALEKSFSLNNILYEFVSKGFALFTAASHAGKLFGYIIACKGHAMGEGLFLTDAFLDKKMILCFGG